MIKQRQSFNIINYVHEEKKEYPITGVYSPDHDIGGWLTERDFVIDEQKAASVFNTFVGGQKYNLLEGTSKSDWNSIVLKNIDYLALVSFRRFNGKTWTPVYNRGTYSIYWNVIDLFSSYHYSGILKEKDDTFQIELREDCLRTSIECAIWTRDKHFVKHPYIRYQYDPLYKQLEFKGPFTVYGTNSGLTGYYYPVYTDKSILIEKSSYDENSDGKRVVDLEFNEYPDATFYMPEQDKNLAQIENKEQYPVYGSEGNEQLDRRYTFNIVENTLLIKGKTLPRIGNEEKDFDSVKNFWEGKSFANPKGRSIFTKFFPIEEGSFDLIALNENKDVIELKEVEELIYQDDTSYCFEVDYDLGIIKTGGIERVDLFLLEDVAKLDKEIFVTDKFDLKSYPESGILKIENELIFYKNKSLNSFYGCLRGYKNTTNSSYNAGSIIKHIKNGKSINADYTLYCSYEVAPKIRYEVSDLQDRFANNYGWLNLKPIDNIRENGIIQISSIDKNVSSLELTVDADLIYGNIFGPLYYGTDYRRLIATAKDALGNPVSDIEITIRIANGPGYLNYSLREHTSVSNTDGETYSLYGVPYDWDSISKRVISMSHKDNKTELVIEPIPPKIPAESVQLYQILKHDPVLGTHGKKMMRHQSWGSWGVTHPEYGKTYVNVSADIIDEVSRFEYGFMYINLLGPNSQVMRFKRNISQAISLISNSPPIDGEKVGIQFLLKESIPSQYSSWALNYIEAFERDAEVFSETNMNGCRRVLYEWRDDIKHPVTENLGAYYPVRPDNVAKELLTYNKLLPLPDPGNINSNIGGYIVVSSDIADFYAECVDPITGNIIRSNTVRVRIDIPNYLNGVSNSTGLPIPYGFKLIKDEFNDCSGIGGATFLSINPFDNNILDLMLEFE